jgi:hypothetical protein
MLGGLFFEFAQGEALAAASYFRAGLRENRVETLAKRMQGEWSSGSSIATGWANDPILIATTLAQSNGYSAWTLTFVICDC